VQECFVLGKACGLAGAKGTQSVLNTIFSLAFDLLLSPKRKLGIVALMNSKVHKKKLLGDINYFF